MTEAVAKKTRKPRRPYNYSPNSIIGLTEKSRAYRGKRKVWFDSVAGAVGKTVAEWEASCGMGGEKNPPRGWLRFFTEDGTVELKSAA